MYHVETERETMLTPDEFKAWVLDHMVFQSAIRRIHPNLRPTAEGLAHIRFYLDSKLQIHYEQDIPPVDHDGGSVIMDVNLCTCWRV